MVARRINLDNSVKALSVMKMVPFYLVSPGISILGPRVTGNNKLLPCLDYPELVYTHGFSGEIGECQE